MPKPRLDKSYIGVSIPLELATEIIKLMKPLGYTSISEFVKEAVRTHIRFKYIEYDRKVLEI